MKTSLLLCTLCLWVSGARAGVMWWGNIQQADQPQNDEGSQMLQMVEQLSRDLQESVNQPDSWLTRYQQVEDVLKANEELATDLLEHIGKVALPITWNIHLAISMRTGMGMVKRVSTLQPITPYADQPEFLFILPTQFTADSKFMMGVQLIPRAEVNVDVRLHFAPSEGEPLDFEIGDVFFSLHLRWHSDYEASRVVIFNDRHNGEWSRSEVTVGEDLWPNVTAGERFLIASTKRGQCFSTIFVLGDDLHFSTPTSFKYMLYCPTGRRRNDPRRLWLTVTEEEQGANEVVVEAAFLGNLPEELPFN